eukprot:CAMPEP_0183291850 /NCGR_PEP_ID=MMETSP0160_2-20130417/1125_1 /TAXON_ID=2839 ORGANISM="Odontella Sinensis, Strain Grunow 1884" /NCGR_SAMPLE_ID=MMETSP0160_2 /ASSEMBLY_ACC=CAM_ASM_000250 /LENGTH=55 /DNA_ID=CAMNT_0025452709 /DNA_START=385 /DNA_END=548 /DNA_ORIENTATION=+
MRTTRQSLTGLLRTSNTACSNILPADSLLTAVAFLRPATAVRFWVRKSDAAPAAP